MPTVVRVDGLSKRYRLGLIGGNTLREDVKRLWARIRKQPDPFRKVYPSHMNNVDGKYVWALRDINLEVERGEVLGIIGGNGSGKSTLLKLLSRITAPSEGTIKLKGRTGSLLEVGTGFHPELTGRENVYLNGAILGMTRAEVDRKFDEIVAFSGIEDFIDTPVKRYSSGMNVRLGFAVAAHLDPEILVIDEVLAVGDVGFQKKCVTKMKDVAGEGRTVLFVSHNMGSVSELCSRAVLLNNGQIVANGLVDDVVRQYVQSMSDSDQTNAPVKDIDSDTSKPCYFTKVKLRNTDCEPISVFDLNEPVVVAAEYVLQERFDDLTVALLVRHRGTPIFTSFDRDERGSFIEREPGSYRSTITLPARFLKPGEYTIDLVLRTGISLETIQVLSSVLTLNVTSLTEDLDQKGYAEKRAGIVVFPGSWTTEPLLESVPQ